MNIRATAIAYRNITTTPAVSERISIARDAHVMAGVNPLYSKNAIKAALFRPRVDELDPGGDALNLCSSGNISHFMATCGRREFVCVDRLPLINRGFNWPVVGPPSQIVLASSARKMQRQGYWHNQLNIAHFQETGIFLLFEILAIGASQLEVFEAQGVDGLYKLVFDLQEQKYCVHFVQALLNAQTDILFIDPAKTGLVMLKAGDGPDLPGHSYQYLENLISKLMPGALIATDKPMGSPLLKNIFKEQADVFDASPAALRYLSPQIIEDGKYGQVRFLYQVRPATT